VGKAQEDDLRSRQKINPYFLERKTTHPQGWTGFALFLQGLKVGFAHFQIQINPAKSRVLLFDEH
jgi:hypothetical protein